MIDDDDDDDDNDYDHHDHELDSRVALKRMRLTSH